MYIPEFWVGVVCTVTVEVLLIVVAALSRRSEK